MTRKQALAASTFLSSFLLIVAPARAQQADQPLTQPVPPSAPAPSTSSTSPSSSTDNSTTDSTNVSGLVVTGSRIRSEYNSASPIQVLTNEQADARGISDLAQFLQQSTLAAGSSQNNSTISSAFVTAGGPGSATLSLRGLGATRTLVLLNGRRVGPAGTRGEVSSVDLNTIPESAVSSIDILKDGASSIYGSDAIAGVVNIITDQHPNGGTLTGFFTQPDHAHGDQAQLSGSFGKTFDRGHFNLAFDYYKQYPLANGDRKYTECAAQVVFDPTTHKRADTIDPRTGKPACLDSPWGQVYLYDVDGAPLSGKYEYDYDHNLGNYIPPLPADPAVAAAYPGAPAGYYLSGYNRASDGLLNSNSPFEDAASLIPELEKATIYGEGAFKIGSGAEAYAEVLLNRRQSKQKGYRQFWTFDYTSDYSYQYHYDYSTVPPTVIGGGFDRPGGGDPFNVGFTGKNYLSPTPVTDWYGSSQKVDYVRAVAGLRGDINVFHGNKWHWDIYGQYSKSSGTYSQQVILKDAIDSQSFRTASCVGSNLPVSGRPCIDINFTDPNVLAGNFTQAQRDFLFDTDIGYTKYTQSYVEGSASGNLFNLPAGPVGAAIGFAVRRDYINDTPGPITLASNSWGLTGAGITTGAATTSEGFVELNVPILKDKFLAKSLDLSLSARYTNVNISGDATTYKAGLNWQVTPQWKFRTTYGTSFRAPALYELYLANETGFLDQRSVDPCSDWSIALAAGQITQKLADNCANPAGPGGGVPANAIPSTTSAIITTGGGLGFLKPETSGAVTAGVTWQPKFADISFAVDYFHIKIKGEVDTLGSNTAFACYQSDTFPTDPTCNLFQRNTQTHGIDTITGTYINTDNEVNEGFDFTVRYRKTVPWGDLINNLQLTYQLRDETALFANNTVQNNGTNGYPRLVGSDTVSLTHNKWTFYWNIDYVGRTSDLVTYGSPQVTIRGAKYDVKATAPSVFFHSLSVKYDADKWSLTGGVANVLDTKPPQVTTVSGGLGEYDTIGTSLLSSQYQEGYYGRRLFIQAKKRF